MISGYLLGPVFAIMVWTFGQAKLCLDYQYTKPSGCIGRRGTNYVTGSTTNPVYAGCAVDCFHNKDCVCFFFNKKTSTCTLHSRSWTLLSLADDPDSICYQSMGGSAYYVQSIESSTYDDPNPDYDSSRIIGNNQDHWHSTVNSESIVFLIANELYATRATIYEGYGYEAFADFSLYTPDGNWLSVWTNNQTYASQSDRVLTLELMVTYFKTRKFRITVLPNEGHQCIKSIRVHGKL